LNLDEWSNSILDDYCLAVKSNNGLILPPTKSQENYPNLSELSVTLIKPFQMFYKLVGEHLILFVRKRRIIFVYNPASTKLIDKLNKGNVHEVRELLKRQDSENDTLYILKELLTHKGIKISS